MTDKLMTETDALTTLRSAVAQFEQSQKLTLAAFLISECNPNFGLKVEQEEALEKAFAASEAFAVAEKLSFAIELLQFCQDKEEVADGIDSEDDDYDDYDLDPYGYDTPALDEDEDEDEE